MSEKKETALRRLHMTLKRRFQGQAIHMSWAEMEGLLNAVQTIEMNHIINSYNEGYADCKAGLPNRSLDESKG